VNFRDSVSSLATDAEEVQAKLVRGGTPHAEETLRQRLGRLIQGRIRRDDEIVERLANEYRVSRLRWSGV